MIGILAAVALLALAVGYSLGRFDLALRTLRRLREADRIAAVNAHYRRQSYRGPP